VNAAAIQYAIVITNAINMIMTIVAVRQSLNYTFCCLPELRLKFGFNILDKNVNCTVLLMSRHCCGLWWL